MVEDELPLNVVVNVQATIISKCRDVSRHRTRFQGNDFSRVTAEQLFGWLRAGFGWQIAPPNAAKAILRIPVGIFRVNLDDFKKLGVVVQRSDSEFYSKAK